MAAGKISLVVLLSSAHLRIGAKGARAANLDFVAALDFFFNDALNRNAACPGVFYHRLVGVLSADFCGEARLAVLFAQVKNLDFVAFFDADVSVLVRQFRL